MSDGDWIGCCCLEEWRPTLETDDVLVRREEGGGREAGKELFKVKMTAKSSNHFYTIEVSQTEAGVNFHTN